MMNLKTDQFSIYY